MAASPSLFSATFLVDQAPTCKARFARSRTSTDLLIERLVILGGVPQRCALRDLVSTPPGRAVGRHCLAHTAGLESCEVSFRYRDHRDKALLELLVRFGIGGLGALVAASVVGSAHPVRSETGRSLERPGRADQRLPRCRGRRPRFRRLRSRNLSHWRYSANFQPLLLRSSIAWLNTCTGFSSRMISRTTLLSPHVASTAPPIPSKSTTPVPIGS